MNDIRNILKPLIRIFPSSIQEFLNTDGGLIAGIIAVVVILIFLLLILAAILSLMFRRKKNVPGAREKDMELDLDACPMPAKVPPSQRMIIQGEPVRLRLIVLAPMGSESELDLSQVARLLDRAVPGLGEQYHHDKPLVKTWPTQVSHHGFPPTFFRKAGPDAAMGDLSRWVLVAGRAMVGKRPFLLGMALWADEPCALGHMTVETPRWQDLLKLREQE